MSQSRTMSAAESVANVAIGYGVAVASQIIIFPLFGVHLPLSDNLLIGKLVDADAARSAVADLCVNFRQAVEVWPDTIGPLLVQKELTEIRQIMQEHAEALLLSIRDEIKDILAEKLP